MLTRSSPVPTATHLLVSEVQKLHENILGEWVLFSSGQAMGGPGDYLDPVRSGDVSPAPRQNRCTCSAPSRAVSAGSRVGNASGPLGSDLDLGQEHLLSPPRPGGYPGPPGREAVWLL